MGRLSRGALASFALAASAVAEIAVASDRAIVMRDDFEATSLSAQWRPCDGFSIVDGAGINGSRGLVWEQSAFRAMKMVAPPAIEGNAVGPVPTAVPERFMRDVPVEPGRVYTFSVKVRGAITNNCAYVFFSWFDNEGALIGRAEGRPTIYKEVGRKDWETVSASTQRMPSEAVRAELKIELYRTTLGRMAFDDFEVSCDETRHVERMFSSAYRNSQDSGAVRFVVPCVAAPGKFPRSRLSGEFTFVGTDGVPFTVPADILDDNHFEASLDVARLAEGKHPVRARFLFDGVELGAASLDFTRGRVERKVFFDDRRRIVVDGAPFFPLGVYVHPADKDVPYLDRLRGSPFNCVVECAADRKMLDKYHAAGLKVIPKAPLNPAWAGSVVKGLGGHPALLAWYVIDETPADRADQRRQLQKVVEEADPDHPTFAVLSLPRNADAFMGAFDIISSDPYPVGSGCGPISRASEYPRICRRKTWGLRPLWQVPQAIAWEWFRTCRNREENGFPSYEELRSMTWQAIAGGADGLLYYSAHHVFKHAAQGEPNANWDSLLKVAGEVKSRVDVLLSDDVRAESSSPDVVVRAFRKDGETWVLAVNSTRAEASAVVDVSGAKRGKLTLPALGVEFRRVGCGLRRKGEN